MLVTMNDERYETYKKFIKESANSSDMVDIPTLVAELEDYVVKHDIKITTNASLEAACNDFLAQNDMKSLVGTEVVKDIIDYIDENYD